MRNKRPRPLTDTKILTGWNGLMIRGLADAGRDHARTQRYVQAAARAADFRARPSCARYRGPLAAAYAGGEQAKLPAYLDDYAFLVDGLIALHQATGDQRWLEAADALTQAQIAVLGRRSGGLFLHLEPARATDRPQQGSRRHGHTGRQFGFGGQPAVPGP